VCGLVDLLSGQFFALHLSEADRLFKFYSLNFSYSFKSLVGGSLPRDIYFVIYSE